MFPLQNAKLAISLLMISNSKKKRENIRRLKDMQQFFQQKHSRTTLNTKYTVTIGNLRLSFAKFPCSIFTLYQAAAPAVTPG